MLFTKSDRFSFVYFRVQYTHPLDPGDPFLSRLDTAYTALCNLETSKCIQTLTLQYLVLALAKNDTISSENITSKDTVSLK